MDMERSDELMPPEYSNFSSFSRLTLVLNKSFFALWYISDSVVPPPISDAIIEIEIAYFPVAMFHLHNLISNQLKFSKVESKFEAHRKQSDVGSRKRKARGSGATRWWRQCRRSLSSVG